MTVEQIESKVRPILNSLPNPFTKDMLINKLSGNPKMGKSDLMDNYLTINLLSELIDKGYVKQRVTDACFDFQKGTHTFDNTVMFRLYHKYEVIK